MGEQTVKNIPDPIRAYRVLTESEHAGKVIGEDKPQKWLWAKIAAVILIVIVGTFAISKIYFGPPRVERASIDKMAHPLPDNPSIAVLPFVNLSEDTRQGYLSNSITEQIITGLSKDPHLFVIDRQSTFVYKDKPVKIQQVAEELGVRYVLEGAVQKSGDNVRITAQLIDALKGRIT